MESSLNENKEQLIEESTKSWLSIQRKFHKLVANYFMKTSTPLRNVKKQCFKDMFSIWNIEERGLIFLTETQLKSYIINSNKASNTVFKFDTVDIDNVCLTTLYYWKNFIEPLLITECNWIDKDFNRKSYLLACRSYTGNANNKWDWIIHAVKDFDNDVLKNLLLDKEKYHREINKITKEGGIITLSGLKSDLMLSLNICPGIELIEFRNTARREFSSTFEKCDALWCKTDRPSMSTVIENAIYSHLDFFDRPEVEFSQELHEALEKILKIRDIKNIEDPGSTKLYEALNLENPLDEKDFTIIEEYLTIFKPVSEAIEKLKNNGNTFYGLVLPCLLTLRKKLITITNECKFIYYKPNEYLNSFQIIFAEYFNFLSDIAMNAAIAAISYPKFKNKWFGSIDVKFHDAIINAFSQEISEALAISSKTKEVDTDDKDINENEDEFFEFESYDTETTMKSSKVDIILNSYLNDKETDLSMLKRHKEIGKVFIKYNTPMSVNLAACELNFHQTLHELASVTESVDMLSERLQARYNAS